MFIERSDLTAKLSSAVRRSRIVALLGPRQCGKTTLAKSFLKNCNQKTVYCDLEIYAESDILISGVDLSGTLPRA